MKKINNKILIIVLLSLAAIFVLSKVFRSPKLESNMRKDLVALDTASVTEIRIATANNSEQVIKLVREGASWSVENQTQKSGADVAAVKNVLEMLNGVDAERMVSRKKEKWETFNVDEKGTNVSAYYGSTQQVSFFIGKSGFEQGTGGQFGGGGHTYVRLSDEEEVYSVKGFYQGMFTRPFNDWRDRSFLRIPRDLIRKIVFTYPADSSFVLEKRDSVWYAGDQQAAQSKVDSYLGHISFKNLSSFADGFNAPASADATIQVEGASGVLATIEGWKSAEGWTLRSTLQKDIFFSSGGSSVDRDLFIGARAFVGN